MSPHPCRLVSLPVWFVLFTLLFGSAIADRVPAAEPLTPGQIAQWIQQLDGDLFAERNEASRKLEDAGPAAFGALAEAAVGDSREGRMRALAILRKQFEEGDPARQQAAREALEKIAASDNQAAARCAEEVLNPKPDPPPMPMPALAIPAQLQIRVNAFGGGGAQAQRIRINNAMRQIETQDGPRKVRISEDPAKGIEVEIIDEKDGEQTAEKFQAKNAAELKEKHPEAFQVYQKLTQQVGAVQVQAVAGPAEAIPAPPRAIAAARRRNAVQLLQNSRRFLETGLRQLQQAATDAENDEELNQSIQRLQELAEQLDQEAAKLAPK